MVTAIGSHAERATRRGGPVPEAGPLVVLLRSRAAKRRNREVLPAKAGWTTIAPAAWMLATTQTEVLSPGVESVGVITAVFDTDPGSVGVTEIVTAWLALTANVPRLHVTVRFPALKVHGALAELKVRPAGSTSVIVVFGTATGPVFDAVSV